MERPVVLGLDFGGSKVAVAAAHPGAAPLASVTVPVRADESAQRTFDRGIEAARTLLAELVPSHTLAAVGACTFGIPRADGIDLAPTIDGWERIAFGNRLRLAFPATEIRMATDVKAAARAEVTRGALAGHDPGLYLNLGTGLAAAVVVGGTVLNGRHGAAGEIGYNLRHPLDARETTRLEDVVSGKALAAAADDLFGGADIASLFERAGSDARAARVCDQFLDELAYHVVNLTIAIDPARVVVGGGMARSWERLRPTLAAALEAAVPFPPDLVLAAFPFDAPLIGALALATDAYQTSYAVSRHTTEGAPA